MGDNGKRENRLRVQSMAKGFAILSVASILVKIISLFMVPIIRRLLGGADGYQVYYSANQVFAFVYVLATAGLPVAISKIVTELVSNEYYEKSRQAFKLARFVMIILGAVLTVGLIALARPLARASGYEDSWLGIAVIAPNVFICSVLSAYRGYLQGHKNMTPTALSQVVEQIVHFVVSFLCILIFRSKGIVWAVAGASAGTVAGSIVALIIVVKYYRLGEEDDRLNGQLSARGGPDTSKLLKLIAAYSIPITLSSAVQYGGNIIDVFIVKSRLLAAGLSETAASVLHGELSTSKQLINVPAALVTALCVSSLPIIAGLYAAKNDAEVASKAQYTFKLCFVASIPCATAMTVFAGPIYQILGFGSSYKILLYMSFSVLFLGVMHIQSSIMQSLNLLYYSMFYVGVGVIAKAVLNYVLISIPFINIYGAVISTYLSYIIPIYLNYRVLIRKRNLKLNMFRPAFLPFVSSAVMLVTSVPVYLILNKLLSKIMTPGSYAVNFIAFCISAAVAIVTYLVSMKLTGGINKEDLDSISPKLSRIMRFK